MILEDFLINSWGVGLYAGRLTREYVRYVQFVVRLIPLQRDIQILSFSINSFFIFFGVTWCVFTIFIILFCNQAFHLFSILFLGEPGIKTHVQGPWLGF